MEKKGLCGTCVNEKGCVFPNKKTPVWQCEEFSENEEARKITRRKHR